MLTEGQSPGTRADSIGLGGSRYFSSHLEAECTNALIRHAYILI